MQKQKGFPQSTIRIEPKTMSKLKYIAFEESRTINKEIERLIIKHVKEYEEKYGEIGDDDIKRMEKSKER